jgi:hypothetical protein
MITTIPTIEVLSTALKALKASSCYAAMPAAAQCRNRGTAPVGGPNGKEKVGPCERCVWAEQRVLAFVRSRLDSVARKVCRNIDDRDDAVAEVIGEYVGRIHNGRLAASWDPKRPPEAIASRSFLRKRLISALRELAHMPPVQGPYRVVAVEELTVEGEYVDRQDVASRWLPSCPLAPEEHEECDEATAAAKVRNLLLDERDKASPAVMVVALLQLFSHLADEVRITGDSELARALRAVVPSAGGTGEDALTRLARLHAERARAFAARIDELADRRQRSRDPRVAMEIRREMEQLRAQLWLAPLKAADLVELLGVTPSNAHKRMERYREYLAELLEAAREEPA